MAFVTLSGEWVDANPAFLDFCAVSRAELGGRSLASLLHPDDQPVLPILGDLPVVASPFAHEVRFLGGNETPQWARLTLSVLEPGLYLVQIDPIQATKDAEKALQENQRRLELAVTAGGVGIWQYDIGRDELLWDDKMYELYVSGAVRTPKALPWSERVHPDDLPAASLALEKAIAEQGEMDIGFRVFRPMANALSVPARFICPCAAGRGLCWGPTGTPRRAIPHESLAREKEQLRVTLNSIADAVIATDHEGVMFMNPVAESLTGCVSRRRVASMWTVCWCCPARRSEGPRSVLWGWP